MVSDASDNTYCTFLLSSNILTECSVLEEGGSTGASDVVEGLEESRADEVREDFTWDET